MREEQQGKKKEETISLSLPKKNVFVLFSDVTHEEESLTTKTMTPRSAEGTPPPRTLKWAKPT